MRRVAVLLMLMTSSLFARESEIRGPRKEIVKLGEPCFVIPTPSSKDATCKITQTDHSAPGHIRVSCEYTYRYRSVQKTELLFFNANGDLATTREATDTETLVKEFTRPGFKGWGTHQYFMEASEALPLAEAESRAALENDFKAFITSLKPFECK